jgi:hypothetical protein
MSAPILKLDVVADDNTNRLVTLAWPDGSQITVHYPSSAGSPQDYGWNERTRCVAWCISVNRVPWIFAFDII